MKSMVLKARTDAVGSDSECDLDVTEEEWEKMTESEQAQLIAEFQQNVCEIWAEVR